MPTPLSLKPRLCQWSAALVLTIVSAYTTPYALATQKIMVDNGAPDCKACHAGGAYSKAEGKAGLAAFLKSTTTPTCTAPQVLQNNTCVTPTPSTPPTSTACTPPLVLQNNACVTPAPTPVPTACGNLGHEDYDDDDQEQDDDDDGDKKASDKQRKKSDDADSKVIPTLSAPDKVSVHAGEQLTLAVTAFDCQDRPITIQANPLPKGAVLTNGIDAQLHMPKAVITWTPPVDSEGQTTLTITAFASDEERKKVASAPQAVIIDVLPPITPLTVVTDSAVKSVTVASARFNAQNQKLSVAGKIVWQKASSPAQRLAITKQNNAVVSDAATGGQLAIAKLDKKGAWSATVSVNPNVAPCAVDVSIQGVKAVKAVKGNKNCHQ